MSDQIIDIPDNDDVASPVENSSANSTRVNSAEINKENDDINKENDDINKENDDINKDNDDIDKDNDDSIIADLSDIQPSDIIETDIVTWYRDTKSVLTAIKSNFLLIFFIPAVVLAQFGDRVSTIVIFLFNMVAIIPLAKILTLGIDDTTARFGLAYATVLHAFSGNLVELIILGFALYDGKYSIVRSSLLGGILSNILLVLGFVFLLGSMRRREGSIHAKLFVSTSASVLALAVLALVTPATFEIAAPNPETIPCDIQNISHATAIILLLLYVGLLVFQLKTHAKQLVDVTEFEKRDPQFPILFDLGIIAMTIAGIAVCGKYLVTSIEELAENYHLGHSFVGMVLLPLGVISNILEHYDAVKSAATDKLDTAISLVLNTSVQIALLVTPILVIVGWIINKPLTLNFTSLEIAVLACSVLIVNYLIADGKANWLEGYMLLASYTIIAVAFFYFPETPEENFEANCNPSRNQT